ncbi:dual specificity protein phosphatase family protein [Agrobacterium tumefaciens]|uniref:dual specificity protein phosphatase family protein n=1 Tax=Agrobacterium tumefaciens TaxID=358 RepID=UPI003BB875C3
MRRIFKGCCWAVATLVLSVSLYLFGIQYFGNFHEVVPGQLYRSSQPQTSQLDSYVKRYGIRTVINLRGANPAQGWYRDETSESTRLGVTHIDFRMSANEQLSMERVDELVSIMRDAPKPILIHCKAGADRSGLASALYLARVMGAGEEVAESQLSLRFGHISLPHLSKAYAMDETWETVEQRLIPQDWMFAWKEP